MIDKLIARAKQAEHYLTPNRRKRIYQFAVIFGGILVARNAIGANDLEDILTTLGMLLGTGVPALAARNVQKF